MSPISIFSFRQLGVSLPLNSSCDREFEVKGLEDFEISDRRRTTGTETPLDEQNEELPEGDEKP